MNFRVALADLDETPVVAEGLDAAPDGIPGERVENDVDPCTARPLPHLGGEGQRSGVHDRVDAEIAYTVPGSERAAATFFLQGRNLLNEQIRLHTSYVKDQVPQPGRTLIAGVRARF